MVIRNIAKYRFQQDLRILDNPGLKGISGH